MESKSIEQTNIQSVKNAVRSLLQNLDRCGISNREQSIALKELSEELHSDPPSNVQRDFLIVNGIATVLSLAIVFILILATLGPLILIL